MPITTGRDKANAFIVLPDRLIPGRICIVSINLKCDQSLRSAINRTLLGSCFVTDKIIARPINPAVHARHSRCAVLGKFSTPNTKAFFKTQRTHRVKAELFYIVLGTSGKQEVPQCNMLSGTAVNLIAQFPAN